MKANSIEDIRKHLAKGGEAYWVDEKGRIPVNRIDDGDIIVLNTAAPIWRVVFGDPYVDHWELLPIEEENVLEAAQQAADRMAAEPRASTEEWLKSAIGPPSTRPLDDTDTVQQPDPLSELSDVKQWAARSDIAKYGNEWYLDSCRTCYSSRDLRWIAEEIDYRNARESDGE